MALSHRISTTFSRRKGHLSPAPWTRLGYPRIDLTKLKVYLNILKRNYLALIFSCFLFFFLSLILFFLVLHLHCLFFFHILELLFMILPFSLFFSTNTLFKKVMRCSDRDLNSRASLFQGFLLQEKSFPGHRLSSILSSAFSKERYFERPTSLTGLSIPFFTFFLKKVKGF